MNSKELKELEKAMSDGGDLPAFWNNLTPAEKARAGYVAARKYAALMQMLEPMLEAREKATEGEWNFVWEAGRGGIVAVMVDEKVVFRGYSTSDNVGNFQRVCNTKFITTAANGLAEIIKWRGKS